MNVNGALTRTIWPIAEKSAVGVIDQTRLPHFFETVELRSADDAAKAISNMVVRGAPLIGATAAYGMALAAQDNPSTERLKKAYELLLATRPTAINLRWSLDKIFCKLDSAPEGQRTTLAWECAAKICDEDVETCRRIGVHGLELIRNLANKKAGPINILTHCNAGWLATVDWGTATSPIYQAHDEGIELHVWVDETRPRNQGAALTAWELLNHGVPHHLVTDNSGGLLMMLGLVDIVIVGTDRTTAEGDVCNKIGTYLKALAAHDNGVPFYVALPSTTIDFSIGSGLDIPIEERKQEEVTWISGKNRSGDFTEVLICPEQTPALNHAFDITPARLVTGLITERGVIGANAESIAQTFPKHKGNE
jgi:methylthioribose-1-phosphate isomerase